MKRAVIGGFLLLTGALGTMSVFLLTANNMVSMWSTPPGRFLTTTGQNGMTPLLVGSCVVMALGLLVMGVEYFRKDG